MGEKTFPRCHIQKKEAQYGKPKKFLMFSMQAAELFFIEERKFREFMTYRCPVCGKWYIEFHKREE